MCIDLCVLLYQQFLFGSGADETSGIVTFTKMQEGCVDTCFYDCENEKMPTHAEN